MASQDLPASTDLSVGELFGDDLVEIYNAAIEGTNTADQGEIRNLTLGRYVTLLGFRQATSRGAGWGS